MNLDNKGFSLVEILVAVGIISVLSSVAMFSYEKYRMKATQAALKADMSLVHQGLGSHYIAKDTFCVKDINKVATIDLTLQMYSACNGCSNISIAGIGFNTKTACAATTVEKMPSSATVCDDSELNPDDFKLSGATGLHGVQMMCINQDRKISGFMADSAKPCSKI